MKTSNIIQTIDTLNQQEKIALEELLRGLKATYGSRLEQVILYGSKAKGNFDKESDIDILVVIKGMDSRFKESRKINEFNNEIGLKYDLFISVFPVDSQFFQSVVTTPFYHNVINEGISL